MKHNEPVSFVYANELEDKTWHICAVVPIDREDF